LSKALNGLLIGLLTDNVPLNPLPKAWGAPHALGREANTDAFCTYLKVGICSGQVKLATTTQAATQHLSITAEVADIRSYTTHKQFDVVLIDRVLHMLSADERIPTLERYLGLVATSGFLLLMDTPANIKPFHQFLKKTDDWKTCLQTNNTLFTQKIS